jgi:hypothetical protein
MKSLKWRGLALIPSGLSHRFPRHFCHELADRAGNVQIQIAASFQA